MPKYCLTHDQSFPGPSGMLVNLWVKRDLLPPIIHSLVMSRLIHYIINTRWVLPDTKIFLWKIDLDTAYRWCSLSSSTSWESMTIYVGLLLATLQITFGGSPCPNLWGVISKTIADVANSILHNNLYEPFSDSIDRPKSLPDNIPFHRAKDLAAVLPDNREGYIYNIYIYMMT